MAKPVRYPISISATLDEDTGKFLAEYAEANDRTTAQQVRRIVREWVDYVKTQQGPPQTAHVDYEEGMA